MERFVLTGIFPEKRATLSNGPHFLLFGRARNFREFAVPFRKVLVSSTTPLSPSQQFATWRTCHSLCYQCGTCRFAAPDLSILLMHQCSAIS